MESKGDFSLDNLSQDDVQSLLLQLPALQDMKEKEKIIKNHLKTERIWQGKDERFYTYLPDVKYKYGRKLVAKTDKEKLEDTIVEYYKKMYAIPYISQVFELWIKRKLARKDISRQTQGRYETDFRKYIENSILSEIRFNEITEDILQDFIFESIAEKNMRIKAWNNLKIVLKGIFKYAKEKKWTQISISHFLEDLDISHNSFYKPIVKDEEQVFTDDEVEKLINLIFELDYSVLNEGILICFQTGLRAGELATLKYSDCYGDYIIVQRTEIRYKENRHYHFTIRESTKGHEDYRQVVITEDVKNRIEKIHQYNQKNGYHGDYLFHQFDKKEGYGYLYEDERIIKGKAFTVKLYKLCERLDILPRSLHKIRKTYATKLLNSQVEEKTIIKQLGHSDILTTKKHYYLDNRGVKEKQKAISNAIDYKGLVHNKNMAI